MRPPVPLPLARWAALATVFVVGCGSSDGGPAADPSPDAGGVDSGAAAGGAGGVPHATGGAPGTGGAPMSGTGGGAAGSASSGTGGSSPGLGGQTAGGAGQGGTAGRAGAGGSGATGGRGGSPGAAGRGAAGAAGAAGAVGIGGSGPALGGAGGNLTIWLAGDSTVANGSSPCPIGWGAQFRQNFNSRVMVTNSAAGGTSLHTWLYSVLATQDANGECNLTKDASGNPVLQPRWQAMLTGMKAGDYLFIQFGINDGGACPRFEGAATFRASLGMMAQAAKDRGAHPVFVTPVSSIRCTGTTAVGTRGRFVTDTIAAGTEFNVPVLDLHMLSVAHYTASGFCPLPGGAADVSASTGGAVGAFFCDDHTHFSPAGAVDIGNLVVDGIRALNLPLASYLN